MSENLNNRNKEIIHTRISDSSDEENSSEKEQEKKGIIIDKSKIEYISDNNPELCIHITEEGQKKKKHQVDLISYNQFINAIKKDDKILAEKILKSCQSKTNDMINYISLEGFNALQYAAFHGSVSCFDYLISLKSSINMQVEGLPLIHLSLSKGIFRKNQTRCVNMFNYIYENLPEQRKCKDRLGRTFLHLIFEYDFSEALDEKIITMDDLFLEDANGDYAINYVYLYNSGLCFYKVAKDPRFLGNLYREIRNKYSQNKIGKFLSKEKFLENLFIHQNLYIIAIIVLNCSEFVSELMEDLNSLKNFYSQVDSNKSDFEQKTVIQMNQNINYVLDIIDKYYTINGCKGEINFDFPQKLQQFTAVVFNSNCVKHIQLPDDPIEHLNRRVNMYENSDRLACLIDKDEGIILNDRVFHFKEFNIDKDTVIKNMNQSSGCEKILFFQTERKGTLNDILKCHDIGYIENLKNLCEKMKNENNNSHGKHNKNKNTKNEIGINYNLNCINTNPSFQNSIQNNENYFIYQKFDNDTYINEYSYENIYNTTGCVFDAIDLVMKGTVTNAFALIRPPGHHAGYYGPVENPILTSIGFCIVNNVAIGAAYAKYKYKNDIKKIAIFDFDVHHGNGTEEIIQMLNGKSFTDSADSGKNVSFSVKTTKKLNWLDFDDAKNLLFISTHVYIEEDPKTFYPYSGSTENNTNKESDLYPGGILNVPFGLKNNNNPKEYRNVFKTKVIPRLHKFKPDLIFISAGFDGHEYELINRGRMQLTEFDFAFITQQIQFTANKFCKGRVVSVLEGGYNVSSGLISSFAQSAFVHTRFLNLSINMFYCCDFKLTGVKRKNDISDENDFLDKVNKGKIKPRRSDRIRHQDDEESKKDDY